MSSTTTEIFSTRTTGKVGAHVCDDGVSYGVWAPGHDEVAVTLQRESSRDVVTLKLEPVGDGFFSALDAFGRAGDRYGFLLGDGRVLPDPVSRFQPDGVHELSQCIDPRAYRWRSDSWSRPVWRGQSIYELHVGTFTPEGTFRAAIEKLEHLVWLGVEAIELMPVADFPGRRNWGYDGVALYAPARCYGRPDDLRALVDAAHEVGLAMILDVVYNHLGPDGAYLSQFAAAYFHPDRHTPWGQSFNLSGRDSRPVRDYFIGNAAYWLDEFRFDGLRLDATHAIIDESPRHLLAEIADVAHARGAFLIAEDERNTCELLARPDGSGQGIDAAWSDDFHHQVRVALTGVQDAYFKSYRGSFEELARTLEHGWFYTGQNYAFWKGRPKGDDCRHLPPSAFVYCIENHDQVGNRAKGERLEHLIGPAAFRAASALLCLAPYAPMIFMGQEWAAGTPFLYFTDHAGELGHQVSLGRQKEFAGLNRGLAEDEVPDPQADETFFRSKLVWDELRLYPHATVLMLYRECLHQRAAWLHGEATSRERWKVMAFDRTLVVRYFGAGGPDHLLVAALQGDTRVGLSQHVVLEPPADCIWELVLDSNRSADDGDAIPGSASPGWGGAAGVETLRFDAPATVLLVSRARTGRGSA